MARTWGYLDYFDADEIGEVEYGLAEYQARLAVAIYEYPTARTHRADEILTGHVFSSL